MQTELERSAVFRAARRKFRLKLLDILGILGNWREILTYSTGLIKHSDYRSRRDFLNFSNSIATFKIKSIVNIVLGGREEKGSTRKIVKLK